MSTLMCTATSSRRSSVMMIPILLLLLLLTLTRICPVSEAFSPHSLQQHSQSVRIKIQLNNNDQLMKQHRHSNTVVVWSVYSPVFYLQLAANDDNDNQESTNKSSSLIRRVLTLPLRLFKRPIRYLRRKIGKGYDSSQGKGEEVTAAGDDDSSATSTTTMVATTVETESPAEDALDTKSPIVDEKKNTRDVVKKATKGAVTAASMPVVVSSDSISILDRSPTCAKNVDLSGHWDLLVTDEFKNQYDNYLTLLGQPYLVRSVAMSIVALTTEETKQTDNGRSLYILGRNLRGVWERNLITDDGMANNQQQSFVPLQKEIITADGENVMAEAWWEDQGTTHRSWLRGVKKYGGGDFESKRYLENDTKILVCESTFHPNDPKREKAKVTWRFTRQQQNKS